MVKVSRLFLLFMLFARLSTTFCQSINSYTIIPQPAQLQPRSGEFILNRDTRITIPFAQTELQGIVDGFARQIDQRTGLALAVETSSRVTLGGRDTGANLIQFILSGDTTLTLESYRIDATDQLVTVEARHPMGFFYAVQTLYQLLPPTILGPKQTVQATNLTQLAFPTCLIQDRPRYRYRGMQLDVSRHFFTVEFIKKYLDLMALHKFNMFHWHLTDDQGWRIEIKKYPKLTQVGALRSETIVGHYDDHDPQVFDGKPYGGYYTQDEIREVVRYAATKYITVVPEIELPGHALAALAAYPALACSVKPYQVATKWGVFTDVLCPTEKTFAFLEDVLTEVMSLFPGKYIHIGGDECPKLVWRNSAFCQQLIKRERLKNENGLQSYFVNRIDKFVTSKGRQIIGWDEVLEGNGPTIRLSPKATVMSWRGIKGGIQAARQGHDVIMTPGQFCYFNFYQGDQAQEPLAFGESLPLSKVYAYNPTPAALSTAEATHILGAQGNVWTEYIDTPDQAEYMIWPRAAALAEVVWTPLAKKNYDDFTRRLSVHFERLTNLNVNYARSVYNPTLTAKPTPDGILSLTLSASQQAPDIRYTLDGRIPSGESLQYTGPVQLSQSALVRAATFQHQKPLNQLTTVQQEFLVSKATGKSYTLLNAATAGRPDRQYSLTDGTTGTMGGYDVLGVVSFATDLNMVIDLNKPEVVERVRVGFLKYTARNLCLPKQVEIAVSDDGTVFRPVLTARTKASEGGKRGFIRLPFEFTPTTARYLRIIARTVGRVPANLRNPGKAAQLALDEIEIY